MNSQDIEINMDGELEYIPGTKELYTGSSETHYENGTLNLKGYSKNGKREGKWTTYKPDGSIESDELFKDGVAIN